MPVVFVHGVSVRNDHAYYAPSEKTRDALFQEVALVGVANAPSNVTIANPYWGQWAASFAWDRASLPSADDTIEAFGSESDLLAAIAEEAAIELVSSPDSIDATSLLTAVARQSLPRAIDLMWTTAGVTQDAGTVASSLAKSGLRAQQYAKANPNPPWLARIN